MEAELEREEFSTHELLGEENFDEPAVESEPTYRKSELELSVVVGSALTAILVVVAMAFGGSLLRFVDVPGVILVFGGTLAVTLINFTFEDVKRAYQASKSALFVKSLHPLERVLYLVELAQTTRRQGKLFLDSAAAQVEDEFLAKGLELAVDEQSTEDVRRILENEIITVLDKQRRAVQVLQSMAGLSPALGLIGTLIGLVRLLDSLNDPSQVGSAMALALLTTFYGAILANLILVPLAGRLRIRSEEELLVKRITIEGVLSLAREESPIVMEQRLQSFLAR